jgi:hypothetical protein
MLGNGHPGRGSHRHQTKRHWITSFQLLAEAAKVARAKAFCKAFQQVDGSDLRPRIGAAAGQWNRAAPG